MATEKSVYLQDAAEVKAAEYVKVITQYVQAIKNDPTYVLHDEDVKNLIDQTLQFVNDNGLLSAPSAIQAGSRFRTLIYNDLIDTTKMDLSVSFARMRALLKVINVTTNIINSNTYKILSEIDQLLDKIANLSKLKNTFNEYDDVIYNTFIEDNNSYKDIGFKTNHGESGGIITLRDIITDNIIEKENNFDLYLDPLNKTTVTRIFNNKATSSRMSDGLDFSLYSLTPLEVSDYQVGFQDETRDTVSSISYNGGAVGVILRFPTLKFINHIDLKMAAAGLMDILGVYYSTSSASNIQDYEWISIDFSVDTNNIRGADINFPTKEASSVMIVLGQSKVRQSILESDKGLMSLMRGGEFDIKKLADTIEQQVNVVSKGKIKEYAGADVVDSLSDETARAIDALIASIEMMLPPEERDVDIADPNNYQKVNEYNFCIYDVRVDYVHYFNNSTYKSDFYGGVGDVANILITSTGNEISLDDEAVSKDVSTSFYIEMENGQHRAVPFGTTVIKDISTIEETASGITFDLDVLADDAQTIEVFVNGVLDPSFEKVKQYASAPVVLGVKSSEASELNFGDNIIITYRPSAVDTAGKEYNPFELSVDKLLGNPVLINQDLIYGSTDRVLIELDDGTLTSYNVPDQINKSIFPAQSGDDEAVEGYSIVSGQSKGITFPDDLTGSVLGQGGTIFVPETAVKVPSKTIYNGILEEEITVSNGQVTFNTAYAYIPGTLHVSSQGRGVVTNEYTTDTSKDENDKTYFDTAGIEYVNPLIVSYMPAKTDVQEVQDATESNISLYNFQEFYQGTDDDGGIQLPFYPHVDPIIRKNSTGPGAEWTESRGKFVNGNNEEIVYEPIRVTINGRTVENITDYLGFSRRTLARYNELLKNYQYYIDGNKLIFNTIIKGQLINVAFYKQNDKFRLVSKLYRNNRKRDDITPEVYGYSIYLNKRD